MELTEKDYISILKYYGIKTNGMKKQNIKEKAESILANKLCKCIKKVNPNNMDEPRAIAICTDSVLRKKGLKANRFVCKKKPRFIANIKTKKKLTKIKKSNKNSTIRKK